MKKAFLFDMDGVLVDTQWIHTLALQKVFARYGVETDIDELNCFAGTKRGTAITAMVEKFQLDLDIEKLCDLKDEIFDALIDETELEPIPGIPELLQGLKDRSVPTAIASSSSPEFIGLVVDRVNIRPYFDRFVSGQLLPKSKPDPAIYLLAAKEVGIAPEDCVVLEDAALGVEAAKAAGMYCIGYRNPSSGEQDLSKAGEIVEEITQIDLGKLFGNISGK